jgi:hypothetical protein
VIDPLADELFPLAQAAQRLPRLRGGRPVNPSTLWRWATSGLRGVKLEICRVGGVACTSAEALRRFFAELNGRPANTPRPRPTDHDQRVERELDARGI